MVLLLPLRLCVAALVAAAVHELSHLIALRVMRVRVWSVQIGAGGAKIATESMLPHQELICALAGPAGGFAGVGESFNISAMIDVLGQMEAGGGLPDTVLFSLNMNEQAPLSVLQGSFAENGVSSKVQLGPAWWWCDHKLGIENTLSCIASFGVLSQFIGMTTDSRSILSFIRHDYFRRILCSWLDEKNKSDEWELSFETQKEIIEKICYKNSKQKIIKGI
jgi:glucuronate isomerase